MTELEATTVKSVTAITESEASDGMKIVGVLGIITLLLATLAGKGDQK